MNPFESMPPLSRRPRLLVIEDFAAWRRQIGDLLRGELRCGLEEVADAYTALRLTQANPAWDLVVIDLDLPGMNGFELYFRLRDAAGGLLAVIFTTSLPGPGWVRVDAPRESRIIQKPVEAAEFLGIVRRELAVEEPLAAGPTN